MQNITPEIKKQIQNVRALNYTYSATMRAAQQHKQRNAVAQLAWRNTYAALATAQNALALVLFPDNTHTP